MQYIPEYENVNSTVLSLVQQLELSPKPGKLMKNAPEFLLALLPRLRSNDSVFCVVGELAEGAFRE